MYFGINVPLRPGAHSRRLLTVIAAVGTLFIGAQAYAVDSTTHSGLSKRQMAAQVLGCMRKRMSSSRTISYNEAMKVCRDQFGNSPSGTLLASDTSEAVKPTPAAPRE